MPLARRYVDYRLARGFDGVFVAGLEAARASATRGPLIVAANHVAWWDPLVAVAIDARLGTDGYALMDAVSLARLPFFAAVGALQLRRDRPRAAHDDVLAAAALLDRPGRAVWIYPQGKQRPAHLRPLGLASGVRLLAAASGAPVLPLSVSYLYGEAPQPAIYATFGEPLTASSARAMQRELLPELEAALIAGLDHNDAFATRGEGAHQPLWAMSHRSSVPLGGRLLARAGGRPAGGGAS